MGDLDRPRRAAPTDAVADNYDYGCRDGVHAFGAGDGRLEIVKSNIYSASQISGGSSSCSAAGEPPSSHRGPSLDPALPPSSRRGRSSGGSMWCFNDPEMKRRRRVARYKSYAAEDKLKASIRKGFRWFKIKCSEIVHGR